MFIVELIYKVPLHQIDAHMKEHVIFLNKYYASGNFLISGRKNPREGGIIIATAKDKNVIAKIIKQNLFIKNKLADFRLIEFNPNQKAGNINELIEQLQ